MEREKFGLAPYLAVAAPFVVAVVVAFAAYVDRKVAPVAEYVAKVYGLPVPAEQGGQQERVAAAQRLAEKR